jgi:hypothetical protein
MGGLRLGSMNQEPRVLFIGSIISWLIGLVKKEMRSERKPHGLNEMRTDIFERSFVGRSVASRRGFRDANDAHMAL